MREFTFGATTILAAFSSTKDKNVAKNRSISVKVEQSLEIKRDSREGEWPKFFPFTPPSTNDRVNYVKRA